MDKSGYVGYDVSTRASSRAERGLRRAYAITTISNRCHLGRFLAPLGMTRCASLPSPLPRFPAYPLTHLTAYTGGRWSATVCQVSP